MKLADFDCRTGAAAVKNRYEKGSEDAAATGKEEQQHSREVDRSRGRIYTSTLGPGDYYNKHNQVMCCHGIRRYRCEDCQQSTIKRPVKRRRVSHGDAAATGKEGQQHSREVDRSRGRIYTSTLEPGDYYIRKQIFCFHGIRRYKCEDCKQITLVKRQRVSHGDSAATGKQGRRHSKEVDLSPTLGPGEYRNKHGNIMCRHDRRKYHCKDCGGAGLCTHGKRRYACEVCKQSTIKRPVKRRRVSHGDAAATGKEGQQHSREVDRSRGRFVLGPGEYRDKHNHIMCQHDLFKVYCATCGGTGLCTHGKPRSTCKDCKQSKNLSKAPRDKLAACKEARSLILQGLKVEGGYGSIRCHHKRTWYQCVECKGPGVCEHDKTRSKCPKCKHMYKKRKYSRA